MSMISEQVKELREMSIRQRNNAKVSGKVFFEIENALSEAADTIEALSAKLQAVNMENGGGWIPADELPKDSKEVLIFNGKSYSVGYYDGKEWVNAIHPVKWKSIEP